MDVVVILSLVVRDLIYDEVIIITYLIYNWLGFVVKGAVSLLDEKVR